MAVVGHGGWSGSSPRGRGKLVVFDDDVVSCRLIPARAGKTAPASTQPSASAAHPRAGGENKTTSTPARLARGSSPRGRGKPRRSARRTSHERLIPARAGKTRRPCDRVSRYAAHPRAGGENCARSALVSASSGSSPRGRGKRELFGADSERCGLIPARAGKTSTTCARTAPVRAHPRAGGENMSEKLGI